MVIARQMAKENNIKIEWLEDLTHPVSYPDAVQFMEQRVADIHENRAPEIVRLLEHPPAL